ncbi:hypothetical protein [Streptomyces sp. NBC_01012]|uniref:hypothetical protein n=1 Tax=Streptomyces sp. NBC_01012 TaxID=2903717 RepID=UPI0038706149|nr:hypothetical protein OG623_09690 [Streptomyces sp. NBC_01012]
MHRFGTAVVLAAAGLLTAFAPTASAAPADTGEVTVFRTEVAPLTTYAGPRGCHKLPADAHVLVNRSERPVTVYGDPFCLTPGLTVQPGHGAHVAPGSGSFSG